MMDEKNFFEVFPSLKLKKELKTAFDDAMVTHISMNSSKTVIKIYLIFNRLVENFQDCMACCLKEMKKEYCGWRIEKLRQS